MGVCIYIYTHTCLHVCIYVYTYIYIYICIHMYCTEGVYTCIHIGLLTYKTYMYMYMCMYIHTLHRIPEQIRTDLIQTPGRIPRVDLSILGPDREKDPEIAGPRLGASQESGPTKFPDSLQPLAGGTRTSPSSLLTLWTSAISTAR